MGIGTGRGKLLLFGEHAAVYGHPAVGLSLPWKLTASHSPGPAWTFPGLGPFEPAARDLVERLAVIAGDLGLPPPPTGTLEVTSQVPLGSGFGSSGALCAALVNLFYSELPLGTRDLAAWRAEGLFHGTPSGIDTALALREGWWALDTSTHPVRTTTLPVPGLTLVVGAVVRRSDTKTLVGDLARRRLTGEPQVTQNLASLGSISSEAAEELGAGKPERIPGLVTRARECLRSLGLETPDLTAVLDAGLRCPGALGGKLSGAGGGGAFFLVFESAAQGSRALAAIESAVVPEVWTVPPQVF